MLTYLQELIPLNQAGLRCQAVVINSRHKNAPRRPTLDLEPYWLWTLLKCYDASFMVPWAERTIVMLL